MSLLLDWGTKLVGVLVDLGEFLDTPIYVLGEYKGTPGEMILTSSIVGILVFKVVKFFTDIIL